MLAWHIPYLVINIIYFYYLTIYLISIKGSKWFIIYWILKFIFAPKSLLYLEQADTPLEASRGPWGGSRPFYFHCSFKMKGFQNVLGEVFFFLGTISPGRQVVPSPKIVINLPRTYNNIRCKEEPYRFSVYRDPSQHTKITLYNRIAYL